MGQIIAIPIIITGIVDNVTLEASAGKIQIKDNGVNFAKINGDEVLKVTKQIYTGSGFDSTTTGSGTDTQDHELTAVASSIRNYVKIKITGAVTGRLSDTTSKVLLKAQIKETSGAYGDIIAFKEVLNLATTSEDAPIIYSSTYEIIATLTAGQKTNGYQIKVFSESQSSADSNAGFTNFQTVLEEAY